MFCEATEFGDSTAWYNMALSYEKGLGTKQSFQKVSFFLIYSPPFECFKNFSLSNVYDLFVLSLGS